MIPSDLTAAAPGQKTVVVTQLAVEIAVMRVGNKQMTQSVFRQLPERRPVLYEWESPHHFNIEFKGEPWGIVQYSFEKSHRRDETHVVYSLDGRLYRFPVSRLTSECRDCAQGEVVRLKLSLKNVDDFIEKTVDKHILQSFLSQEPIVFRESNHFSPFSDGELFRFAAPSGFTVDGDRLIYEGHYSTSKDKIELNGPHAVARIVKSPDFTGIEIGFEEHIARLDTYSQDVPPLSELAAKFEVKHKIVEDINNLVEISENFRASLGNAAKDIECLEQLFIAV